MGEGFWRGRNRNGLERLHGCAGVRAALRTTRTPACEDSIPKRCQFLSFKLLFPAISHVQALDELLEAWEWTGALRQRPCKNKIFLNFLKNRG